MIRVDRLVLFIANQVTVHSDPVLAKWEERGIKPDSHGIHSRIPVGGKFASRIATLLQISWLNPDRNLTPTGNLIVVLLTLA